MSRNPRSTTPCRPPPGRQANPEEGGGATAAVATPAGACRVRPTKPPVKSTIPKRGPPPAPPKKLDYKKPAMTKAMEKRLKHTKMLQEEIERKERERARKVRRTAVPVGGDARMGRERRPAEERGRCPRPGSSKEPPPCPTGQVTSQQPPPCPGSPAAQQQSSPCPGGSAGASRGQSPCPRGRSPAEVPTRTRNLAKSMNADIVHAEPLQAGGTVDNLIIPPGAINSERTTIVSIPQPEIASSTMAPAGAGQAVNRSVQVISETLDEQDAVETAVVNTKLQDLQQARRDFVMAVANVGGNSISLQEEDLPNLTPISDITPPMMMTPEPPSPQLQRCPSLDDSYLQVEYGRNHPVVEAAREYMRSRQTARPRIEDYARFNCPPPDEDLEQEYLDACGMVPAAGAAAAADEDDDDQACVPTGQYTAIPRRSEMYRYGPLEVDRLERFFDVDRYPPAPPTPPPAGPMGPPPGRECLPPDLWEMDDPWYREASQPDLIQW